MTDLPGQQAVQGYRSCSKPEIGLPTVNVINVCVICNIQRRFPSRLSDMHSPCRLLKSGKSSSLELLFWGMIVLVPHLVDLKLLSRRF